MKNSTLLLMFIPFVIQIAVQPVLGAEKNDRSMTQFEEEVLADFSDSGADGDFTVTMVHQTAKKHKQPKNDGMSVTLHYTKR